MHKLPWRLRLCSKPLLESLITAFSTLLDFGKKKQKEKREGPKRKKENERGEKDEKK